MSQVDTSLQAWCGEQQWEEAMTSYLYCEVVVVTSVMLSSLGVDAMCGSGYNRYGVLRADGEV